MGGKPWALSLRTHSTPLMPGRLMSISTTSGFTTGNSRKASSADPYQPRQRKSRERPRTRISASRMPASSSTIATVMLILFCSNPFEIGQADGPNIF